MSTRPFFRPTWQLPAAIRSRLGKCVGRQRPMAADGHLLLVLHAPPKPEAAEREGRFFWRNPQGEWTSKDLGSGIHRWPCTSTNMRMRSLGWIVWKRRRPRWTSTSTYWSNWRRSIDRAQHVRRAAGGAAALPERPGAAQHARPCVCDRAERGVADPRNEELARFPHGQACGRAGTGDAITWWWPPTGSTCWPRSSSPSRPSRRSSASISVTGTRSGTCPSCSW